MLFWIFNGRLKSIKPREKLVGSRGSLIGKIKSISGESSAIIGALGTLFALVLYPIRTTKTINENVFLRIEL